LSLSSWLALSIPNAQFLATLPTVNVSAWRSQSIDMTEFAKRPPHVRAPAEPTSVIRDQMIANKTLTPAPADYITEITPFENSAQLPVCSIGLTYGFEAPAVRPAPSRRQQRKRRRKGGRDV